jgi:hypothetical protein
MSNSATIDPNRLAFLQGVLAAFASSGAVVHYDEIRRLCRFSQEQLGEYLGQARVPLVDAGQPDFCAIVVNDGGWPGDGWGKPDAWPAALRLAHRFWRDRRRMDNTAFEAEHGAVPAIPGLWK